MKNESFVLKKLADLTVFDRIQLNNVIYDIVGLEGPRESSNYLMTIKFWNHNIKKDCTIEVPLYEIRTGGFNTFGLIDYKLAEEKETKSPEESKTGYYLWSTKPFNELKKGDYIYECPYKGRFANTKKPPFTLTDVKREEDGTISLEYYNKDCKTAHHNLPPKAKYALFRLYDYNPIEEAVKDFIESKIEEENV